MTVYLSIVCPILLALAAATYFWQKKLRVEIAEGSKVEFERLQKTDATLLADMPEDRFHQVYMRAETPRITPYWLVALAIFLLGTPLFLGLMGAGAWALTEYGIVPEPTDLAEGLLLEDGEARFFRNTPPEYAVHLVEHYSGFYYFFGLLGFWMLVVTLVMRHYHKNRPGRLRDELLRAK